MRTFARILLALLAFLLVPSTPPAQDGFEAAIWKAERHVGDLNASIAFEMPSILISGAVADTSTHQAIVALVGRILPLEVLRDEMFVAAGGVTTSTAAFALAQLARMANGTVVFSSGTLSVVGEAKSDENAKTFESELRQTLPANVKAGEIEVSPPRVESFTWTARRSLGHVQFDGFVPSDEAKGLILAEAKRKFPAVDVKDNTVVALGAPDEFLPAARIGLDRLQSYETGLSRLGGSKLSFFAVQKEGEHGIQPAPDISPPQDGGIDDGIVRTSLKAAGADPRSVAFLFATDRAREDLGKATIDFGSARADALTLGVARVHVPEDHRIGHIELPGSGLQVLGYTLGREDKDPKKHFIVTSVEICDRKTWKNFAKSKGDEALVFVHGFNTSFEDAVFRMAQIVWDLQYPGTAVLFSWPSKGRVLSYEWDRNSALVARAHLIELIKFLEEDVGIKKVHVLAHSMGNLVVLDALSNYAQTADPLKVGQLIMAAPDVDSDEYAQAVVNVSRVVGGMTLYASATDAAMVLSRTLAQGPRAGDLVNGKPALAPGVDAIDVSAIGDETFGLNHDTFASNRSLIDDVKLVLGGIRPPNRRLAQIRVVPEGAATPLYWRYAP